MTKMTMVKKVPKPSHIPDDGGSIPYSLKDQIEWLKVIKNRKLRWYYIPGLYTDPEFKIMFDSLKHRYRLKKKNTQSKNSFGDPLYRIAKKFDMCDRRKDGFSVCTRF